MDSKGQASKVTRLSVAAASLGWALFLLFAGSPAIGNVGSCPGSANYDFIQDRWDPANTPLSGVRAPIELRKNGDVCTSTGVVYEWVGVWGKGGAISQVGWADDSTRGYCRFWYWDNGSGSNSGVTFGRCGQDSVGTARLYKVEDTLVNLVHYYSIYDCGTSSWQSCGGYLDAGPTVGLASANAAGAVTESPFGQNCLQVIMGDSTNPTVYGGSLGDIKEIQNYGDAFTVHSLTYVGPICGHYSTGVHTDQKLSTYDNRN